MNWNEHSAFVGEHAFLSASKYHWVNYDDEKLLATFRTAQAAAKGTELHAFAAKAISLGIKLPRNDKTINAYVNDAIGFKMTPEQPLVYSVNCFGTADAISYRKGLLRIHDLKTGTGRVSMKQLYIYASLFCLEYKVKPAEIDTELRIYQNDAVAIEQPDPDDVTHLMDLIIHFDRLIETAKGE